MSEENDYMGDEEQSERDWGEGVGDYMGAEDEAEPTEPVDPRSKKGRPPSDPLARARKTQTVEMAEFLSLVSRAVHYTDFMDLDPAIHFGVDDFNNLRSTAIRDQFFPSLDDAEVCRKLKIQRDVLLRSRRHSYYEKMRTSLMDAARSLGSARTVSGMAEAMEPQVAREMLAVGILSSDVRAKVKMLDSFADRRSSKKGRQGEQGVNLMLPQRFVEAMQLGLEMEKHLLARMAAADAVTTSHALQLAEPEPEGDVIEISAKVVNVPRREEAE